DSLNHREMLDDFLVAHPSKAPEVQQIASDVRGEVLDIDGLLARETNLAHRLIRHREHLRRRGEARALEGGDEAIENGLRGASRELLKDDRAHQRVESLRPARGLIRAD